MPSNLKSERTLYIYSKLTNGEIISKRSLADYFNVTEKSIQRDIDTLRCFLSDHLTGQDIVYDSSAHGYKLENINSGKLSNSEILAVCKILLESRSMIKSEMEPIIRNLIQNCVPEQNKQLVNALINNELYHYTEPHHGKSITNNIWEIGKAIFDKEVIEIEYYRLTDKRDITRIVEPVGLMFSEFYFYLTAFIHNKNTKNKFENIDDIFPTIYRIDRIKSIKFLNEKFFTSYTDRFEEGEFRKRVQFMYGGKLEKITFKFTGVSVESVLDRLPTAKIISENENEYIISAEVFGKGIDMWIRSQGENIEVLKREQRT